MFKKRGYIHLHNAVTLHPYFALFYIQNLRQGDRKYFKFDFHNYGYIVNCNMCEIHVRGRQFYVFYNEIIHH